MAISSTSRLSIAMLAVMAVFVVLSFELGRRSANGVSGNGAQRALTTQLSSRTRSPPQLPRERSTMHLSVDKPIAKPGDVLFFRVVQLHALHLDGTDVQSMSLDIHGPKGDTVHTDFLHGAQDSVGAFEWTIPHHLSSGQYVAVVKSRGTAPTAQRKFEIRARSSPRRLQLQLEFGRNAYAAGETVEATLHAKRATGEPAEGAVVRATARLDGDTVFQATVSPVSADGLSTLSFPLPATIRDGDGQLSVSVDDGGVMETVGKTLPVAAPKVLVFPEGGHLVASVPSRVYIEASTPWGEPADVQADVRDVATSATVASVFTSHEGRGVSTMWTPQPGATYALHITSPPGITSPVAIPDPEASGVCLLALGGGVYDNGTPVSMRVQASEDGVYRVALFRRETELASTVVSFPQSDGVVTFLPPSTASADGVLRVTVFDNEGTPVAERLVYRRPTDVVNVEVVADKSFYTPGSSVEMTVRTTDGAGRPVPATVGLTVTDETVQAALPTRRHHPRLPVMALLEDEVAHLEDPAAYPVLALGGDGTTADDTIDLLLGTQGWRRFVYDDIGKAIKDAESAKKDDPKYQSIDLPEGSTLVDAFNRMLARLNMRVQRFGGVGGGFDGGQLLAMPVMMQKGAMRERGAPRVAAMPMAAEPMAFGNAVPDVAMAAAADVYAEEAVYAEEEMEAGADMMNVAATGAAAAAGPPPPMAPPPMMGDAMMAAAAPDDAEDALDAVVDEPGFPGMDMPMMPEPMPEPMPDLDGPGMMNGRRPHRHHARRRRPQQPRRVYAHTLRGDAASKASPHSPRRDFTETVFWAAALRTDHSTGTATVRFQLSQSTTAFKATADAFAPGGLLGSGDAVVVSDLPLTVEARVPTGVTVGDSLALPISTILARFGYSHSLRTSPATVHVEVATAAAATDADTADTTDTTDASSPILSLASDSKAMTWTQSTRGHAAVVNAVATAPGLASVTVSATDATNRETDSVQRSLVVRPGGFPVTVDHGGLVKTPTPAAGDVPSHPVFIPSDALPGSLNVSAVVYSSPVASLTQALEALIRAPCGCFEQTASSTYPLIMAQQYFKTHSGVDPDLVRRADAHLETGYKKLAGFETQGGGFEWFGGSPAHESLTAYGALLFQDMKHVFNVDPNLLRRTRDFLRGRADGSGGFERNPRSLDSFGRAPDAITNAYIVYSLTSDGETGLDKEVQAVVDAANADGKDPYLLGLAAGILFNVGRIEEANTMARRLVHLQDSSDGSMSGATTSITCSGGRALAVEATSIAVLAWLNNYDEFAAPVRAAMTWLVSQCQNGRFGSTQATVLALKAIIAYDIKSASPKSSGSVALVVDGATVDTVTFTPESKGALVFDANKVGAALTSGAEHSVSFTASSDVPGVTMPYSFHAVYSTNKPPSSDGVAVRLMTALGSNTLAQGEATELTVKVQNLEDKDQPMVVAIVSLPGGLEPRHDKLRELVQAGTIAFYEVRNGHEVTLYWRGMPKLGTYTVSVDVVAAVGGTYTGDASRAYLYYTDELKSWAPGLGVTVNPAA